MRIAKLKLVTATVLILLGSQATNVLADTSSSAEQNADATAGSKDTASPPAQTTQARTQGQAQAPQAYRGYPPPRYYRGHRSGWTRPFGDDGPAFRGPWKRGRGHGFGFGNSSGPSWGSGSGPHWNSGPRFRDWDDWDRDWPFDDRDRFFDDPFYDRGPRYYDRGPRRDDWDWDHQGMSFGW